MGGGWAGSVLQLLGDLSYKEFIFPPDDNISH